jgi:hypothetical protein
MEFVARFWAWLRLRRQTKRLDRAIQVAEREEIYIRALVNRVKHPFLAEFLDESDPLPHLQALRDITEEAARKWRPW